MSQFILKNLLSPCISSFLLSLGILSPLPWKNNLAYAQQASDLLPTNDFPLRPKHPNVNDSVFQLTQEVPESSKSTAKKDRSGWALIPVAGTLGVGGHLSRSLIRDRLNFRGGFSSVVFDGDITTTDVKYDTNLRLRGGIPLVLDWFPAKNWFRISGGLIINGNRLELEDENVAQGEDVEIGGETFPSDLVGQLDGNIEYNDVSPYIGIGIGNPVGRGNKFRFFLEAGLMFQGDAEITLEASGPLANALDFLDAIEEEIGEIDEETKFSDLPVYPVVQLGFSYQF